MGEWDNYCDEIGGVCKDMEAQDVRIAGLERWRRRVSSPTVCSNRSGTS